MFVATPNDPPFIWFQLIQNSNRGINKLGKSSLQNDNKTDFSIDLMNFKFLERIKE